MWRTKGRRKTSAYIMPVINLRLLVGYILMLFMVVL